MSKQRSDKTQAKIKTVTQFIDVIAEYANKTDGLKCYRGQKDSAWKNVAGILRNEHKKLAQNEKRAIRDLISVHPQEFATDQTMFDKLVRMQHFGLPTRLLDVSLNPLVGLYFATDHESENEGSDGAVTAFAVPLKREKYFDSDSVSCLANLANMTDTEKDEIIKIRASRIKGTPKEKEIKRLNEEEVIKRLHQFIRSEKPYFLPLINPIDLFKPYYVHPKMSNRRILAQAGAFMIYGLEPRQKIRFAHEIEETKFIVAKNAKIKIRKELDRLGINQSTLYPELDKAAARIKAYYNAA